MFSVKRRTETKRGNAFYSRFELKSANPQRCQSPSIVQQKKALQGVRGHGQWYTGQNKNRCVPFSLSPFPSFPFQRLSHLTGVSSQKLLNPQAAVIDRFVGTIDEPSRLG